MMKFQKIGNAISRLGDPNVPDYTSGKDSEFELKRFDALQREEEHESGKFCFYPRRRCEVPLGPRFNTPQWDRTTKHNAHLGAKERE